MTEAKPYTDILFSIDNYVATITINRPDRLNAFTGHTIEEMRHALQFADNSSDVGVIVFTGAGSRSFSAGGDMEWEVSGGLEGHDWFLGKEIVACKKPVIARVNGYAIGGGHHLAYFCDFTIASEHSIFGQNGPRVGSPAGGYLVAHLAGIIGHKRAREMWMLCRKYSAQQALEWGLINAVVPEDQLDAEVRKWADEMLALSPTVLTLVKSSFYHHMNSFMDKNNSDMLKQHSPDYFSTGEQQEGARAFLEKRKPDFSPWR